MKVSFILRHFAGFSTPEWPIAVFSWIFAEKTELDAKQKLGKIRKPLSI